jgi:hypothetical protein
MGRPSVQYKCEKCQYITNKKSNFESHQNRKTPCKKLNDTIMIVSQELSLPDITSEVPPDRVCRNCKQVFQHSCNMYRHLKTCKINVQHVSTIVNNHTINNGTLIQNIHINTIGNENVEYILSQHDFHGFAKGLISGRRDGIAKLFTMKHLNEAHPENNNIRKQRLRTPFLECFSDGAWTTRCYKDAMDNIMQNLSRDFEAIVQKVFDENGRIDREELNAFMNEVGEPLSMDFTGEDYDWAYSMTDNEKDIKRRGIYLLILEILYMRTRKQYIRSELINVLDTYEQNNGINSDI